MGALVKHLLNEVVKRSGRSSHLDLLDDFGTGGGWHWTHGQPWNKTLGIGQPNTDWAVWQNTVRPWTALTRLGTDREHNTEWTQHRTVNTEVDWPLTQNTVRCIQTGHRIDKIRSGSLTALSEYGIDRQVHWPLPSTGCTGWISGGGNQYLE